MIHHNVRSGTLTVGAVTIPLREWDIDEDTHHVPPENVRKAIDLVRRVGALGAGTTEAGALEDAEDEIKILYGDPDAHGKPEGVLLGGRDCRPRGAAPGAFAARSRRRVDGEWVTVKAY